MPRLKESGTSKIQVSRPGITTRSRGKAVLEGVVLDRLSSLPRPTPYIRLEGPLSLDPVTPTPRASRSKGKGKQRQASPPPPPQVPAIRTRSTTREELKASVPSLTVPDFSEVGKFLKETDNVCLFLHISFKSYSFILLQIIPMCTHCIISDFPKCVFRGTGKSCEQCHTGKRSKCTFNVPPGQLIQTTDLLAAATRGSKFGQFSMVSIFLVLLNSFSRI